MNISAFLGGFAAVALIAWILYRILQRKLRKLSRKLLGTANIGQALSQLDLEVEEAPRSLNGCDSLLLPQILRDFPDFDQSLAKTYVRSYLTDRFGKTDGFTVHKIVIARYLPSTVQKCIVFQAAVSWKENARVMQKRFDIHYSYILQSDLPTVAANCPNCGGALGYGEPQCPYCNSRVANVLGNSWEFTELTET